ncbi:hypothetical protein [Nonomuraea indica]|uniref:Molecular chaperone DnaJ n=1 Tax=Nonomuraea indica TaxID=1581193 RepID=A0ABW8AGB3_9ACTN
MDLGTATQDRAQSSRPHSLLRTLLEIFDHLAFAERDARAKAQGRQVRRPAPLIRVYRDTGPRTRPACAACGGTGLVRRRPCLTCHGSGKAGPC